MTSHGEKSMLSMNDRASTTGFDDGELPEFVPARHVRTRPSNAGGRLLNGDRPASLAISSLGRRSVSAVDLTIVGTLLFNPAA